MALQRIVRSVGWLMAICVAVVAAQTARAEPLRVFPDEYIITQTRLTATLLGSGGEQQRIVRAVAPGVSLIKRGSPLVDLFRIRASVPFDPSDTFCERMIAAGTADSCTPNFEIRTFGQRTTSSDPLLAEQWGFTRVGADRVWSEITSAPGSVIAIVDTGVDYTHPDLKGVLWENPGEIPNNGIDDDGNGYIDDRRGLDVTTGRGDPMDRLGHGTHIAGIIAGLPKNGKGVRGVLPNAKILALRIFDDQGFGSLSYALEALGYIEQLRKKGVGVRAVNASWGGCGPSEVMKSLIERLGALGVVVSAAAGNEGENNDRVPQYPASFALSNLLSVAALSVDGKLGTFSNYGLKSVSIAAPGDGIVSTVLNGQYAYYFGTSMAAPYVTSAVALLAAREPDLSAEQLVTRVKSAARVTTGLRSAIASRGEVFFPLLLAGKLEAGRGTTTCRSSSCKSTHTRVNRVTVQGRNNRGVRTSGEISPGDGLEVQVRGSGSGVIVLTVALDSHRCSAGVSTKMVNGKGRVRLRTPKKLRSFRKISIISGRRSSSMKVRTRGSMGWIVANRAQQNMVCESLIVSAH